MELLSSYLLLLIAIAASLLATTMLRKESRRKGHLLNAEIVRIEKDQYDPYDGMWYVTVKFTYKEELFTRIVENFSSRIQVNGFSVGDSLEVEVLDINGEITVFFERAKTVAIFAFLLYILAIIFLIFFICYHLNVL